MLCVTWLRAAPSAESSSQSDANVFALADVRKLRKGSFFPSILLRHRRIDRALFAVVMEAYVHSV